MIPLTSRSESILKTLIEAYLVEGEPVGSRLLSRRIPEPVSPATIRNDLADLEEGGMLSQPHTSAGRVPTERAYRYYVDRWVHPARPDPNLGARLSLAFDGLGPDGEADGAWLRHATKVLSEALCGVCVALPVPQVSSCLVRLEFVPLGNSRLVAIWVGTLGDVEHQVMDNTWGFNDSALVEMGNFATSHFRGCTIRDMRQRLLTLLQEEDGQDQVLRQRLAELASRLILHAGTPDAQVVVAGLGELGRFPEFGDADRFRSVVAAFEERERLAHFLSTFAQATSGKVQFLIGSENPYLPGMPLATAMRTVSLPRRERVTFALVGPLRLDYVKFLGSLTWWSEEIARRQPA